MRELETLTSENVDKEMLEMIERFERIQKEMEAAKAERETRIYAENIEVIYEYGGKRKHLVRYVERDITNPEYKQRTIEFFRNRKEMERYVKELKEKAERMKRIAQEKEEEKENAVEEENVVESNCANEKGQENMENNSKENTPCLEDNTETRKYTIYEIQEDNVTRYSTKAKFSTKEYRSRSCKDVLCNLEEGDKFYIVTGEDRDGWDFSESLYEEPTYEEIEEYFWKMFSKLYEEYADYEKWDAKDDFLNYCSICVDEYVIDSDSEEGVERVDYKYYIPTKETTFRNIELRMAEEIELRMAEENDSKENTPCLKENNVSSFSIDYNPVEPSFSVLRAKDVDPVPAIANLHEGDIFHVIMYIGWDSDNSCNTIMDMDFVEGEMNDKTLKTYMYHLQDIYNGCYYEYDHEDEFSLQVITYRVTERSDKDLMAEGLKGRGHCVEMENYEEYLTEYWN